MYSTRVLSALLLLSVTAAASGQISKPDQQSDGYPTAVEYNRSPDLPDGVAFHTTLRLFNHDVENGDMESAAWWLKDEVGLGMDEAESLVVKMIRLLPLIDADIKKANAELACSDGVPVAYNEDVYPIMQQMYGIRIAVAESYFYDLKSSVDANTAELLQQFIDKRKLTMGHVQLDFAESAKKAGRYGEATLERFCN